MLVIIVGGIPIAMPTVLSVTLALGAFKLAREGAIVARMSAVEEMAGMDILCSDKTGKQFFRISILQAIGKVGLYCARSVHDLALLGHATKSNRNMPRLSHNTSRFLPLSMSPVQPKGTLTLNKLSIELKSIMVTKPGYSITEAIKLAALSTNIVTEEPIDMVRVSPDPCANSIGKPSNQYNRTQTDCISDLNTFLPEQTLQAFRESQSLKPYTFDLFTCVQSYHRCCTTLTLHI
jgi:hypothetical protein